MWVKAVSSALPFLSINPTSGVDLDNAGDYLKMGAASVGAKNAEKVMANVRSAGPYIRK